MEVLSVQNQYTECFSVLGGSTKAKDWSRPLQAHVNGNNIIQAATTTSDIIYDDDGPNTYEVNQLFFCDNIDAATVNMLSLRLLDELRAAKSRNLTCTEVSIPCDLTTRIASEIMRVSEREPCGIRGCTIYIEFEEEPQNPRRIGILKVAPDMVSTFELYLTLHQDKRGWTSLLPQFMKNLSRSITISPKFNLTKHKLYSCESS